MKLALLQLNPTIGDLAGNARRLLDAARAAAAQGADLAIASELCLPGYPPRDLLERPAFLAAVEHSTAEVIAASTGLPLIFGTVARRGPHLLNQAVLAQNGREIGRATKQLLPSYDVFDERRYFEPGDALFITTLNGTRVAVTICEDAWAAAPETGQRYTKNPLAELAGKNVDLLVNLSASPFTLSKREARASLFRDVAREHRVAVAMVNQVGANDELIFDGTSTLYGPDGRVLARAKTFGPDIVLATLEAGGRIEPTPDSDEAAAYGALVLGVRDYLDKCGFKRAVIGLSGGIDSALVACIAAAALGPENVLGVSMPTRYSSPGSLSDARLLAQNLGIELQVIDIDPVFESYLQTLSTPLDQLQLSTPEDVTWENVQARIRGATLMAIANRTGALLLSTGNKSELAVGYCTLYGDMAGGLLVISDLPKTMVYRVARWLNHSGADSAGPRIPQATLDKPPSAELRPDQRDDDSLPPYEVLDPILERLVEGQESPSAIIAQGFDPEAVRRVAGLVRRAEYKRRQAAPGLILTRKAFGSGRRLPIAHAYAEEATAATTEALVNKTGQE